ncbi:guanylate cyclase 32E-like [Gigantopelta aegis]|uniref:guanylate cyclase 32E-like n=1 Tax=Gigantopelta aegis TaxID=1735272 RepID=UPI001B88A999|nr:guanylate cyclase 32E-like [Gigantopelta aegis]
MLVPCKWWSMCWILPLILIHRALGETFTLGFITTMNSSDLVKAEGRKIAGAMTHAINEVNSDPNILANHTLQYIFADNADDSLRSVNLITQQWKKGAIAFFGPEDYCETEARVAASWNLPIIAYKCNDPIVSDKHIFPTFARTQPPSTHSAKSVIALMEHYGWKKFSIVVEKMDLKIRAAKNLKHLAEGRNMTVNDLMNFTGPYSTLYHFNEIHTIVMKTYLRTRVYVIYSHPSAFIDFVRFLHKLGLTDSGEYVVIGIRDDEDYNIAETAEFLFKDVEYKADRTNESVLAFQPVLQLLSSPPTNPNYSAWQEAVRKYLYEPPINLPPPPWIHEYLGIKVKVTIFAAYLYDAVHVYARAMDEVIKAGGDPTNGTEIFARIADRTFNSIEGHMIYIDKNGDAEANYTVMALFPDNNTYGHGLKPIGRFIRDLNHRNLDYIEDIQIYGDFIPRDEPLCGYDGERCKPEPNYVGFIAGGSLGSVCFVTIVVLLLVYRNWKYEQELASLIWKIDIKDIQQQPGAAFSVLSFISNNPGVLQSTASLSFGQDRNEQKFTKAGVYKGTLVAMKLVKKRHLDLTRDVKMELKIMRELRHNNVVQFIGACVEMDQIHIIMEYCSKGSLEDILENDDVKLDNMFIASIVTDILKGLIYLHQSEIGCHGDLKSSNCLVDSRWVVKITDFGLNKFKQGQEIPYHGEHALYKRKLWMAPELLRMEKPPLGGTQKGDVFSFSIVLYEILFRAGPYGDCHLTPKEIVDKVKGGMQEQGEYFRPNLARLTCDVYVIDVIQDCWQEDPDLRPDLKTVRKRLRPMQKGMKSNIFDNMMLLMERYANNLEAVVLDRTVELAEEKKKTEMLLYRMLPKIVAAQLVRGQPVIPEAFDLVTIYFSDICGFTALSAESTPLQVVDLLNDLYTLFDSIIKNYDVYKVETIGDAYMVVSGLPKRNGMNHAGEIASMSLALLSAIRQFKIRHKPGTVIKLRIGLHSGSVVAGVVGMTMPRYCLFGDTVNTSSRMESTGEALKIHVSPRTKGILDELGGYELEYRGLIPMKGKGEMHTWWLLGEDKKVREKRTRNSDDSGVHLDNPADTSDTHTSPAPHNPITSITAFNNHSFNPHLRPSLIFERNRAWLTSKSERSTPVVQKDAPVTPKSAPETISTHTRRILVAECKPETSKCDVKAHNGLLPILKTNGSGSNSSKESSDVVRDSDRRTFSSKTSASKSSSSKASGSNLAVPRVADNDVVLKDRTYQDLVSDSSMVNNSTSSRHQNNVTFSDNQTL